MVSSCDDMASSAPHVATGPLWAGETISSQLLVIRVELRSEKHCELVSGAFERAVRSFRTCPDDNDEKVQYYGPDPLLTAHASKDRNDQNAALSRRSGRIEFRNSSQRVQQHHQWSWHAFKISIRRSWRVVVMVWPRQPHNRPVATRWADEAKSSQLLAIIINFRSIKQCTPRVGAVGRAVRSFRT